MKDKIDAMIDAYVHHKINLSMHYKILSENKILIVLAENIAVTDSNLNFVINASELNEIYKEEVFDMAFDHSKEELENAVSKRVGNIALFRVENSLKRGILLGEEIELVDSDMRVLGIIKCNKYNIE